MHLPDRRRIQGSGAAAAPDEPQRVLADQLGSLLGEVDAVGAVDLVVGEDAVVEEEPAGAPAAAVVDPLVEDAGDAGADDVVEPELGGVVEGDAGGGEVRGEGAAAAVGGGVGRGGGGGGAGAAGGGEVEEVVGARRGRGERHGGVGGRGDGDGGGAAEGMHSTDFPAIWFWEEGELRGFGHCVLEET